MRSDWKIGATIQARMGSSRLPGKVLKPIMGRPVLSYMVERLQRSRYLETVVVATTTNPLDDEIERVCVALGTPAYLEAHPEIAALNQGVERRWMKVIGQN